MLGCTTAHPHSCCGCHQDLGPHHRHPNAPAGHGDNRTKSVLAGADGWCVALSVVGCGARPLATTETKQTRTDGAGEIASGYAS